MNQNITYEQVWNFLQQIGSKLSLEELTVLESLFQLIFLDYTLKQKFGEAKIGYTLVKKEKSYQVEHKESVTLNQDLKDSVKKMLQSFYVARNHMDQNELYCIQYLLNMINECHMTLHLSNENGEYQLNLSSPQQKKK